MAEKHPPFGGITYDSARDGRRLHTQLKDTFRLMKDGKWRTPDEIEVSLGFKYSWASLSARLRDFRKPKFGGHTVERMYLGGGVWKYRVLRQAGRGVAR